MFPRIFYKILILLVLPIASFADTYDWRIMPLGNSITVGVHGSEPVGGYRDDLQVLMQNNGYDFNFIGTRRDGDPAVYDVDHQGTGGIRADEVLERIDNWLNTNPPDIILLHIGTNDISQENDVESTIEEIKQILNHIYDFDPGIEILLASVVPRSDPKNVYTDELNHDIRNLVTTKQNDNYLVHYVPINEAFKENNDWPTEYLEDSVHPNNKGYHVMALEWYDILVTVIDEDVNPPPPQSLPSAMRIVSGNGQEGTIHEILPEPLVVQVTDENENPASNVKVDFEVQIGNGAVQNDGSGKTQFVEAESGEITFPCEIIQDDNASNDAYVVSKVQKNGNFTTIVTIHEESEYYIWGRVFAPSILEDSFFITVDNSQDTILWDLGEHGCWYWEEVSDRSLGRVAFHLTSGKHSFKFMAREEHSRLDKIVITDDPNFVPNGVYGFPDIYTDQNGEAKVSWLLGNEVGIQSLIATSPALPDVFLHFEANATSDKSQFVQVDGNFRYYSGDHSIANIGVHLNETMKDTTDINGNFCFQNVEMGGNYAVSPDTNLIAENVSSVIISYDAALTARYAVGLKELTPFQILAADADNDGQILTYDASLIARFAVGLESMGDSRIGNWIFSPDHLFYENLESSIVNANFIGIVRGDVHGGWQPSEMTKRVVVESSLLKDVHTVEDNNLIFKIPLKNERTIFSFDLDLSFNPNAYELIHVDMADLRQFFTIVENRTSGRLRLGAFSNNGIEKYAELELKFLIRQNKNKDKNSISLNLFRINDKPAIQSTFDTSIPYGVPSQFTLYQNYPNPFNQETTLSYYLPVPEKVSMKIFNAMGQEVWALVRTYETPGTKNVIYHGRDRNGVELQNGNYYLQIQRENGDLFHKKLSIVK